MPVGLFIHKAFGYKDSRVIEVGLSVTKQSRSVLRPMLIGFLMVGLLAACGSRNETRVLFDGNFYKAKTKAVSKDDRKAFDTVVSRTDQGIRGALAAGEHDAKGYCLKSFGTSEITWTRGPADPNAALYVEGGRLRLSGSCVLW